LSNQKSPYASLPAAAFWRSGVADANAMPEGEFWTPKWRIQKSEQIATAGSCFAQHIGRRLRASAFDVLDLEPAPGLLPASLHAQHGYSMYSARYGNIYTVRQFLQLAQEAYGEVSANREVWETNGRFVDSLRPTIDATGHGTPEAVYLHRQKHLDAVRSLFQKADIFVFTLGLTESWERLEDGRVYPVCPGTVAGEFDGRVHKFRNLTFSETYEDFLKLRDLIAKYRSKPLLRFLLTVSPVPLTATAAGSHVMQATVYSKSVLRAVAGQLASELEDVDYFPSYEIITNPWGPYLAYEPNMRSVTEDGVDLVMKTFFKAQGVSVGGAEAMDHLSPANKVVDHSVVHPERTESDSTAVCDEELLDAFGPRT
jgi:hypothetical protein